MSPGAETIHPNNHPNEANSASLRSPRFRTACNPASSVLVTDLTLLTERRESRRFSRRFILTNSPYANIIVPLGVKRLAQEKPDIRSPDAHADARRRRPRDSGVCISRRRCFQRWRGGFVRSGENLGRLRGASARTRRQRAPCDFFPALEHWPTSPQTASSNFK